MKAIIQHFWNIDKMTDYHKSWINEGLRVLLVTNFLLDSGAFIWMYFAIVNSIKISYCCSN